MKSDSPGRNFVRPRSRRWRGIGGGLLALFLLIGAADCYRFEDRAYADAYLPAAGSEVEVSLTGSWSDDGTGLGSPYDLMVRYLAPDSTFERAELVSVTLRDAAGGTGVELRTDSVRNLRRITAGSYFWKSRSTPVAAGNFALAFRVEGLPLEYRDRVVSGRLRLVGAKGVREVPFTAPLRTQRRQELRSRFWTVVSGV